MKNKAIMVLLLCMLLNTVGVRDSLKELELKKNDFTEAGFVFPASLVMIEDEAFEETAIESVALPKTLISIGNRAFADNSRLKTIEIPNSVEYIGDEAFSGIPSLTVYGTEDSYASRWAEEHHIAFINTESSTAWLVKLIKHLQSGSILLFNLTFVCPSIGFRKRRKMENEERSMRPQDRPELYPINYKFP